MQQNYMHHHSQEAPPGSQFLGSWGLHQRATERAPKAYGLSLWTDVWFQVTSSFLVQTVSISKPHQIPECCFQYQAPRPDKRILVLKLLILALEFLKQYQHLPKCFAVIKHLLIKLLNNVITNKFKVFKKHLKCIVKQFDILIFKF